MNTCSTVAKAALLIVSVAILPPMSAVRAADAPVALPVLDRFENFGAEQRLTAHKVHAVLKTSEGQLRVGTWDGLCLREESGKFRRYGPEHGLSHKLVLCMVEDTKT